MPELLVQTKFFSPTLRPGLVARPQLLTRLTGDLGLGARGFAVRLILVSAPAGFGKTTLVASWLAQLPLNTQIPQPRVAWLSLDENDNDPTRFLAYLIAALNTAVPGFGATAMPQLHSSQPPFENILTLILNDLSRHDLAVILVLDDYHLITDPAVHEALTYLLDHLPPSLNLLIISRSDPPLPLTRLRARGQMAEIRMGDLRFTLDEAQQFFAQMAGVYLSPSEMAALEQRTEGWIAGLQLAALSMKGREDLAEFIAAFAGSHRFILDYLTDEVLERRPPGTKNFLLQTAILDRLCGPLCDAVTARNDSQSVLEQLEQANLFLIPLDDERQWYRYHHLFLEVLRQRLKKEQPENVPELHRRARQWLADSGWTGEAVNHALTGGDFAGAALLIEKVTGTMLRQGFSASLMRWLDAMPEEVLLARPLLCLARAWAFQMGPLNLGRAEEWAQLALQAATANGTLTPEITGEVAAVQAMVAATRNEVARSRELSLQALQHLPAGSPWRSVMTFCLGTAHYLSGEMAAATLVLGQALQLAQAEREYFIQTAAASFLAEIQVFQGHLSRAAELYQQVLSWLDHALPQKGGVMAHAGLAHILCERNQLDAALAHIQLGAQEVDRVGGAWSAYLLERELARVRRAQGDWTAAREALDRAYQRGVSSQVSLIVQQAGALRAVLQLAQGDRQAAESWAAERGLNPDDEDANHPGAHELEYLTFARVLHAQGRNAEALFLLRRLNQAAQAAGRNDSVISIRVIQAVIYHAENNRARALECLEIALALAEPEGYCLVFLEEGPPLADLLRQVRQRGRFSGYTAELLAAFSAAEAEERDIDSLPESLSGRELEVLRMIATGATNRDIATALYLAMPTVKKHVSNILSKLNVSNRTEAVAEARALGLL